MKRPACLYATRFMIFISFLGISAAAGHAQMVVGVKTGIVQYTQGEVSLDGKPLRISRGGFLQMVPGQTLRTGLGFVELVLSPEVYLRMGIFGLLRLERNRLDDTRIWLGEGSAMVEIVQRVENIRTRVCLRNAEVEVSRKGLYRFDAGPGEVRVYGGSAEVLGSNRKVGVKSGRMASLGADPEVKRFDAKEGDSLHQWAARRSFEIFQTIANPRLQNNWQRLSLGWAVNSNYRVRFFSERLLREWKLNQHVSLDAKIAAELEERRREAAKEYLEQQAIRARQELEAARNPNAKPAP